MTDFRVLQTYEEIGEIVEGAVLSVLLPDYGQQAPPDPVPEWYERQAAEQAKRVREQVLMGLDAA